MQNFRPFTLPVLLSVIITPWKSLSFRASIRSFTMISTWTCWLQNVSNIYHYYVSQLNVNFVVLVLLCTSASYFCTAKVSSFFLFFLKFFFGGHMSFFGAAGTPVLDFWWRLLWGSKPEWVLPYSLFAEANVMYIPWDPPLVLHLPTSWWPVCSQSCPHILLQRWGCQDSNSCSQNICEPDALPTELNRGRHSKSIFYFND